MNLLFIFYIIYWNWVIWVWIMEIHIQFNVKSPSLILLISVICIGVKYAY